MHEHQIDDRPSAAGRLRLVDPTDMPANTNVLLALLPQSAVHRSWAGSDAVRLFVPPLSLGQCFGFTRWGRPWGFFTWARLTEEAEHGYLTRTRKLQPGDWAAGDRVWMIDAFAPHGNLTQMAGRLRREMTRLAEERGWTATEARWARTFGTGRVKQMGRVARCG